MFYSCVMRKTRVVTVRGMPEAWKKRIESIGISKSAAYGAAFDRLSTKIESGWRVIDFQRSHQTRPYPVKLPEDVVDRSDRAIRLNGHRLKKSSFAREAVRLYLDIQPPPPPD